MYTFVSFSFQFLLPKRKHTKQNKKKRNVFIDGRVAQHTHFVRRKMLKVFRNGSLSAISKNGNDDDRGKRRHYKRKGAEENQIEYIKTLEELSFLALRFNFPPNFHLQNRNEMMK